MRLILIGFEKPLCYILRQMRWTLLLLIFGFRCWALDPVFSFHLPSEPTSLDLAKHRGSGGSSYLFNNLIRTLYKFDEQNGLVPDLAKDCKFTSPLVLTCHLKNDLKWSDGSPIVAADLVRAFQHLIDPSTRSERADLLIHIKNASAILKGQAPFTTLGAAALDSQTFKIEFSEADPEFLYKTISHVLGPLKTVEIPSREDAANFVTSGPYQISKWITGSKVELKSNPFYPSGPQPRPRVEALFITEDSTALNLYESGQLQFLRRLPALLIPKYQSRPDFFQTPMNRFDYIGLTGPLMEQPLLRRALALSLDYEEFKKIFFSPGLPGCPSLSEKLVSSMHCYTFNPAEAKKILAQIPAEKKAAPLQLGFSLLGGDDIKRTAEWLQNQWKKNLGLNIQIQGYDNKTYIRLLTTTPPPIFRKGVSIDRPTCLAALETFGPDNPENYLKINSAPYLSILRNLTSATDEREKKKWCDKGIAFLMDDHLLIPMGRMHFTSLARPKFKGWTLNEMNVLDLSRLHIAN